MSTALRVHRVRIGSESLCYSWKDPDSPCGQQIRLEWSDTETGLFFSPVSGFHPHLPTEIESRVQWMVDQKSCIRECRSFLFSREFRTHLLSRIQTPDSPEDTAEIQRLLVVLDQLHEFGYSGLIVVPSGLSDHLRICLRPAVSRTLSQQSSSEQSSRWAKAQWIDLPLDRSCSVDDEAYGNLQTHITRMNMVLHALLPGLQLVLENLGSIMLPTDSTGHRVQILSSRTLGDDCTVLPLQYESAGIRRLVSILDVLIDAFHSPSVCLAVDDLDTGCFEYLLGELVKCFQVHGNGQLIFTAHNLRPLETISPSAACFVAPDPPNPYGSLQTDPDQNLRDLYLYKLLLGDETRDFYPGFSSASIAFAFSKAGRMSRVD